MNASALGTVVLTVALLAIGAGAGVVLMPEREREPAQPAAVDHPHEERLQRLEEAVASLQDATEPEQLLETIRKTLEAQKPFQEARMRANETAAIATLRNIISAQAQFQQSGKADTDDDGTGEYGGFVELSGAAAGRMVGRLVPPVLSSAFRVLNVNGEVSRSGYFFKIFLPDPAGAGVGEPQTGYRGQQTDADLAETTWCCYAWPVVYGESGKRAFFTNQGGDVIATDDLRYARTGAPIAHDAAFQSPGSICGSVAIGIRGNDGRLWRQVN